MWDQATAAGWCGARSALCPVLGPVARWRRRVCCPPGGPHTRRKLLASSWNTSSWGVLLARGKGSPGAVQSHQPALPAILLDDHFILGVPPDRLRFGCFSFVSGDQRVEEHVIEIMIR